MGLIIKQSIKGTFWSYLGVLVGFITTAHLFPEYLTTDVVGLFGVLMAYSALFSQLASLGFNGVTSRLFPYFRNNNKQHNGFLFIAFMVMFLGFALFLCFFYFYYPHLVSSNIEKSKLLADYAWLLLPLTFFALSFAILDEYNKLLYNAVFGRLLQEFVQRILILLATLLFIFRLLSLHQFIIAYTIAVSIKAFIIFIYLWRKKEISLIPQLSFLTPSLKHEMRNVAIFSILAGVGGTLVFQIDKIIINHLLGLGQTGVYTIAFFFGTLVVIPSRTLLKISGALVAEAWKREDTNTIIDIYRKSCLNQFIMGLFLFGGIWINIDNILTILGPDYAEGKWVIFFIGLGYLIDMATGINGQIIAYSKHYRMALYFILILIIQVVASLYLFVPLWGIMGAAVSIALSFLLNNILRFAFLYKKYTMQPFSLTFLYIIGIGALAYGISLIVPQQPLIADIIIRSALFSLVFGAILIKGQFSKEINNIVDTAYQFVKNIFASNLKGQ